MKYEQSLVCVAACIIISPSTALDGAPLPARDLHAACVKYAEDPESESGRLCDAYVRGFIAGLKATSAAPGTRDSETFSERALRTRLGVKPTQVCNTQSLTPVTLIGQLLSYVEATSVPQPTSASELLAVVVERLQLCG